MSNIWFTSDLHMMHNKGFLYEPRGFTNEKDMCEAIVENWNKVVKPEDTVYNLGDIALSDIDAAIPYLQALNGTHWWIRGNHDSLNKVDKLCKACKNLYTISNPEASWATMVCVGKIHMYMSHYPTLTANFDEKHFSRHVISLHGHTHQRTNWLQLENPFLYHVGVDSHNNTPVHIDEVLADIRNRWNAQEQLYEKYKEDTYGGIK